ncbi:DUF2970 domain-containing protein [Chromatocurvus halotolerans]|uniref:DUF2970 family protein n=1 Tax=Chromatocurvus halotolerans TaxID=1132028 RepID=A0A4R2KHU6_9GAMM|nr:DUF2970 domain-containing protein [Chromatocurvus halotolerans]TCO72734.1 DUF2970 family protein [Chromatocurvus halotolerans]
MQDKRHTDGDAPEPHKRDEESPEEPPRSLKPRQIISSVFAAGLGVQSSKNRERDFTEGNAGLFIIAGLVFTALFIGGVYLVVQVVLKTAV